MKRIEYSRQVGAACGIGLMVMLLAIHAGCGGNDSPQVLADDELVGGLVGSMSDYVRSPENFQFAFSQGSAPADSQRQRYREHGYVVKAVRISGDQAEITVGVTSADNAPLGDMTWTAARQGDQWKLTAAPLP